jgi:uncharacterized protein YejL (UPF0352 family)
MEEKINKAQECMNEIVEVLKKHNCILDVKLDADVVMGKKVVIYTPVVVQKLKEQDGN